MLNQRALRELQILMRLLYWGPQPRLQLARDLGLATTHGYQDVQRLEAAGLVKLIGSPKRGRGNPVLIDVVSRDEAFRAVDARTRRLFDPRLVHPTVIARLLALDVPTVAEIEGVVGVLDELLDQRVKATPPSEV